MKNKVLLIIGLGILVVGVALTIFLVSRPVGWRLFASTDPKPQNITVSAISANAATIAWQTDSPTLGSLSYGLNPNNLTLIFSESGEKTITHQAKLDGLLSESQYYFTLQIAGKNYQDSTYRFTTTALAVATPTPTCASEDQLLAEFNQSNSPCDLSGDGLVSSIDLILFRQSH